MPTRTFYACPRCGQLQEAAFKHDNEIFIHCVACGLKSKIVFLNKE